MKTNSPKSLWFIAFLALSCLSGCSTPGATYARAHPELSPVHRQILMTGIIPGGVAADGMTKEQVKMAAGDPTQHEQINGGEVWIYVREKFVNIDPHNDPSAAYGSGPNNQRNFTETANLGPRPSVIEKVSVFFDGERVTHVQITRE